MLYSSHSVLLLSGSLFLLTFIGDVLSLALFTGITCLVVGRPPRGPQSSAPEAIHRTERLGRKGRCHRSCRSLAAAFS